MIILRQTHNNLTYCSCVLPHDGKNFVRQNAISVYSGEQYQNKCELCRIGGIAGFSGDEVKLLEESEIARDRESDMLFERLYEDNVAG